MHPKIEAQKLGNLPKISLYKIPSSSEQPQKRETNEAGFKK